MELLRALGAARGGRRVTTSRFGRGAEARPSVCAESAPYGYEVEILALSRWRGAREQRPGAHRAGRQ